MGSCCAGMGYILGEKIWRRRGGTWRFLNFCWKWWAGGSWPSTRAEVQERIMATVRIPEENKTLGEFGELRAHLATMGIDYERWKPAHEVAAGASAAEILAAYAPEIERLKAQGGYVTA